MTSVMLWVGVPTVILVPMLTSGADIPRKLFIWIPSLIFAFLAVGILFASQFSILFLMIIAGIINVLRFNTLLTLPVENHAQRACWNCKWLGGINRLYGGSGWAYYSRENSGYHRKFTKRFHYTGRVISDNHGVCLFNSYK